MKLKLAEIINPDFDGSFNPNGFDGWRLWVVLKNIKSRLAKKITVAGNVCNIYSLWADLKERKTIYYGKGYNSFYLADNVTYAEADFSVKLKRGFLRYELVEYKNDMDRKIQAEKTW